MAVKKDQNGHARVPMVDVTLGRIVIREGADQQFIYLKELVGERGFSIVIGTSEACEIRRVVVGQETERPLTHQLAFESIVALGAKLERVDIVDLRNNTFFARLVLVDPAGAEHEIDARPSDAVALAMRAHCPLRVSESVFASLQPDDDGPEEAPSEGVEGA